MKKVAVSIIISLLFFFILTPPYQNVSAQLDKLLEKQLNVIPGLTCGVPNTTINRCCYLSNPVDNFIKSVNPVFAAISFPISPIINSVKFIIDGFEGVVNTVAPVPACVPQAQATTADAANTSCVCVRPEKPELTSLNNLCNNIQGGEQGSCRQCLSSQGVWTAIGCVYGNLDNFIKENIFSWAIGLAGIVGLLCIIYAAFTIQTSRGNPEKLKKAQELLTSCIMGLMLIIFSVFILRLIGVNILKIPGFQ